MPANSMASSSCCRTRTRRLDRPGCPEHLDLGDGITDLDQQLPGITADRRRRRSNLGRRGTESRRRRRLTDASDLEVGIASAVVRVDRGLGEIQHRRETGIGPLEQLAPLGAGLLPEQAREFLLQLRPARDVELRLLQARVRQPALREQQPIELRLERADRDPLAVGAAVTVVPVRTTVERIRLAPVSTTGAARADPAPACSSARSRR